MRTFLVLYRLHPGSGTYYSRVDAESDVAATAQASRDGLFECGRFHVCTVPVED
jgi:hypothetical protein